MKKLIFLLILIPALCWGQAQIGRFNSKKGGVVKHPGYTVRYEPWGAIATFYIGEGWYDATGVTPAIDTKAEAYWNPIFYAKLDWNPPLELYLWNGVIVGYLTGGNSDSCRAQTDRLVDWLKRSPVGEVLSNGEVIYRFPWSE